VLTGMKLKVSLGNSKIGKVPNVSLPPISTCRADPPCAKDCYANKLYRMYPNVKAAWDSNLALYQEAPDQFFGELSMYLTFHKPERFRLFVSGDFPDEVFFVRVMDVFASYPMTQVLCFTKRYEFPLYVAPPNVNLVLSLWPGLTIPDIAQDFACAWLADDDRREPGTHVRCHGNCVGCDYKCFSAVSPNLHVVFERH
jgi:hypothetical protein